MVVQLGTMRPAPRQCRDKAEWRGCGADEDDGRWTVSMPAPGVTVTAGRLGDSPDPLMGSNVDVFHLRNSEKIHEATGGRVSW